MTALTDKKKKNSGSWYYRLPFPKKMGLWGVIFLIPWIIGFFVFFLYPIVEVVRFSFHEMSIMDSGREFIGFQNYYQALQVNPNFTRSLVNTLTEALLLTPLVIIFSLLCAILLNGKFRGRGIARAIFFIPIIMATGLMLQRVTNLSAQLNVAGQTTGAVYGAEMIAELLYSMGIGKELISYLLNAVNDIFRVVSLSGVQILIFLSALQSINPSLYEVAKIEGATGYETFWKVTVVMVSPMVLTCTVYTLADLFLRSPVIELTQNIAFLQKRGVGLSAAMSITFLIMCVAVIGIVSWLIRKVVFYYD